MEGLLLPQPPGKDYRLLKVVTQPATPEQVQRLGNDRVPVFAPPVMGSAASAVITEPEPELPQPPPDQLRLPI
jgi:hypothetical protein